MATSTRRIYIEKVEVLLNHCDQLINRAADIGLMYAAEDSQVTPAMILTVELAVALKEILNELLKTM